MAIGILPINYIIDIRGLFVINVGFVYIPLSTTVTFYTVQSVVLITEHHKYLDQNNVVSDIILTTCVKFIHSPCVPSTYSIKEKNKTSEPRIACQFYYNRPCIKIL